ncbi:M28 family peptidase [Herbiconiux moechotypicola]|uniref:M28 family metallopeptidase n=1 Tax=Herbiconiux moechotypicola TaxID=637393 RepID=A0ABN3DNF0_9MICO|nr:M28 family peptidase [Herbiconiux moechotypicola]MCS5730362.1 M28 family peptidase [Herbiconiux moechotypicola]
MKRRHRRLAAIGLGTGVVIAGAAGFGSAAYAVDPADLESRVTVAGVMAHLEALQAIAEANDGNRALGTSGYEASGAYVEEVLTAAGYIPERQEFIATTQSIDEYSITLLGTTQDLETEELDRIPMEGTTATPPEGLTGLELVEPAVLVACTPEAWDGVDVAGKVALVSRGECAFADKSLAASAAGAAALLVYNNEPGPLAGTLGEQVPEYVPTVGLSQEEGAAAVAALEDGPVTIDLQLQETTTSVETFNIIAQTPSGDPGNVVMLGAHLDSVQEGAGINDNGSGSAAILETAVQLAASGELNNAVRFAWWGAEEVGLVGSTHYVEQLAIADEELPEGEVGELDKIATYLNFDMVASPNYVISVYDADESTFPAPVEVPEGSIATEKALTDYFDANGQPWIDTAFDARSDYDAFIAYGVPASGLFTGADDVKTEEQVALFGGTAGVTHDPNYHSAADDITNVNEEALGIMVGAIASVTGSLANDTSAINGVVPPSPEPTEAPSPTPDPTASPSPTTAPGAGDDSQLAATGADLGALGGAIPVAVLLIGAGAVLAAVRMRAAAADRSRAGSDR